jgi:hypothetical protein
MTPQQLYDHNRYMANREARIAQSQEYHRDYYKKGLRKPRPKRQPRAPRDHQRYLEKREEILAKQKIYRDTHKGEIAARRRKRKLEKIFGK